MSSHTGLDNMLRQTINGLKKLSTISQRKGKLLFEASTLQWIKGDTTVYLIKHTHLNKMLLCRALHEQVQRDHLVSPSPPQRCDLVCDI